ncbi:MAG: YihY/virulence factor BrkB family protein [Gemmatimonadaceae bacterium]|nr:YihY/virulence factor BrkB family protein [Chitinophagaceae bacterium]
MNIIFQKVKVFFDVFKRAVKEFIGDNAIKHSASLSYYTIFALGPLLIIIPALAGVFFGREAVQGKIYGQIKGLVGSSAALQVQEIIQNIEKLDQGITGAIVGFILLIIGATGVFTEIQDSINYIWSIKSKPKKGWLKLIINRLLSFSLIIGLGFILLVSLVVNALMDIVNEKLARFFPDVTVYIFYVLNIAIIFVVIALLFAVIFKVLPDATIRWKDAFVGSFFTAFLFLLGKLLIGLYLGNSNIGVTYGAAASVVIILLWVYYSSIILYFGAEFTKVYTIHYGSGIKPHDTAVFIIKREAKEILPSHFDE